LKNVSPPAKEWNAFLKGSSDEGPSLKVDHLEVEENTLFDRTIP
jgi:hypothetical protein